MWETLAENAISDVNSPCIWAVTGAKEHFIKMKLARRNTQIDFSFALFIG